MKVSEKKLEDGKILLEATASAEEVNKAFDAAHVIFAQQMQLRPQMGMTVAQVAEAELGIKDLDAVVQPQVGEYLVPFAIDKKNITPAHPPQALPKNALKRNSEYQFSLTVTPKPAYELSSYEPVSITVAPFTTDPAEVEKELASIAERYVEYVTDEPRIVASGDSCMIAIEATMNGEPMKGLTTEGRTYTAGIGLMPEGFDKEIVGMNVGETKSFSFEGPGIDEKGNETAEKVDCKVTVIEMQKKVIPAITDAWVAKTLPMFKDLAALRGSIEARINETRKSDYDAYVNQVAAAELAKRFSGRIEDEVYESMQKVMLTNMQADLQRQGLTLEQFIEQNGGQQQFQMMLMIQVRETLTQGYSLDALFRHEKLQITEEDLENVCRMMNPQNPKMARERMEETGNGFAMREMAERMKANKWLVDHAEIKIQGQ